MNALAVVPDAVTLAEDARSLSELQPWLAGRDTESRIEWALSTLSGPHVLSSSFGAQSAVLLHMATRIRPDLPVLLVDTGYLFDETYRFIDELSDRLDLNLHIVRPELSPQWLEARHGRLWEQGRDGIERYNRLMKVQPMNTALDRFGARTWVAGLRRSQSESRARIDPLMLQDGRWKLHPLFDWSNRDLHKYLARHDLPYHPLWNDGYVSIGDRHSTRPIHEVAREEDTRFAGIIRECGLHEAVTTVR
ncbi:MAG: phosphoadenylyl-sulfate reductase [Xanthomonadales bacterium]|nr:phosphoadenylyl-sulfate reductase [Xanthomonadales bacterium]